MRIRNVCQVTVFLSNFEIFEKLSKNSLRKPYDGVFNQSDDMILLSLFMRVITGQTPSLPSLGD